MSASVTSRPANDMVRLYPPCPKHDRGVAQSRTPCPHCAEDAKLLDEAVEAVGARLEDALYARDGIAIAKAVGEFKLAVRDLIREARR